jgi:tRNA (uracil-5-)-methyltransferase
MPLQNFDPAGYPASLAAKRLRVEQVFSQFSAPPPAVFASPTQAYRMRAEFRIWHEGTETFYAMFRPGEPKTPIPISEFPIASTRIQQAMPILMAQINANETLRRKLFQVEFLSTLSGELLITLIYHRALGDDWLTQAQPLEALLGAHIIGRSRKKRLLLSQDYVDEVLPLASGNFHYRQFEQGFTQPNAQVNIAMINWACDMAQQLEGDLLELYCGNGNFTLPLSHQFRQVLATEVAKSSIRAAQHNRSANNIANLEFVRLSAEEAGQALQGVRPFRRLAQLAIPLADYQFSTIFVDPPRAGLDPQTEALVSEFDNIIYISCNPSTLANNLAAITRSHQLQNLALFDQFPYTNHIECGAFLSRRSPTSSS